MQRMEKRCGGFIVIHAASSAILTDIFKEHYALLETGGINTACK